MAYTIELTNGSDIYSFVVQPEWEPDLEYTFNESVSPAVLVAETETWILHGAVYQSATPANVTTDFATLSTLLSNRTTPVNSVKFKSGASTIRELKSATHAQLMVKSVKTNPGPGQFVNHWQGTIVVVAKKLIPGSGSTANIVRLEKRIRYTYDEADLLTQTMEGRVETVAGTSAKTTAEAQTIARLGTDYVFETGGDNGLEVSVENSPDDTIATFRQIQRQIGTAVPATAKGWRLAVETVESAEGKITTTEVSARGTSVANARTAARTVKPTTNLWKQSETEHTDGRGYSATYVKREKRTTNRYGKQAILSVRRAFSFDGGGQDRIETPIPGRKPFVTLGPWRWLVVREAVAVRAVGVASVGEIPLPAILWPDNLQKASSSDTAPELDGDEAEVRPADVYVRRATRVYVFPEDAPDAGVIAAAIFSAPAWASEPDYTVRMLDTR